MLPDGQGLFVSEPPAMPAWPRLGARRQRSGGRVRARAQEASAEELHGIQRPRREARAGQQSPVADDRQLERHAGVAFGTTIVPSGTAACRALSAARESSSRPGRNWMTIDATAHGRGEQRGGHGLVVEPRRRRTSARRTVDRRVQLLARLRGADLTAALPRGVDQLGLAHRRDTHGVGVAAAEDREHDPDARPPRRRATRRRSAQRRGRTSLRPAVSISMVLRASCRSSSQRLDPLITRTGDSAPLRAKRTARWVERLTGVSPRRGLPGGGREVLFDEDVVLARLDVAGLREARARAPQPRDGAGGDHADQRARQRTEHRLRQASRCARRSSPSVHSKSPTTPPRAAATPLASLSSDRSAAARAIRGRERPPSSACPGSRRRRATGRRRASHRRSGGSSGRRSGS